MSEIAAVIILWGCTIACFAVIAICARREVRDMDAETAALWAECPWPVKDQSPFHNGGL